MWSLVNEFVRVSLSVLLNLVFELNFLHVLTGQEDSIESDVYWTEHIVGLFFSYHNDVRSNKHKIHKCQTGKN